MRNKLIKFFLWVTGLICIIPIIWLSSLYFTTDANLHYFFYDPDAVAKSTETKEGEIIIIGIKPSPLNLPFNCGKLSEELTQCTLENNGSKLLVAFPKSKGISPEDAASITILIVHKQNSLVTATIEHINKSPFFS